ncbi:MAG TPA: CHRD domain-containing protein [Steroidobacteraceae bacterium]|nr:CHRD domain-containing protein [Steroidobacteraceae bacterium]
MITKLSRRLLISAGVAGIALWSAAALAAPESFQVQLTGAQQVPAVQTDGTATADLTYDPATRMLSWSVSYSGLSSPVTMAHFHDGAEGKNGKPVLWLTKQGSPVSSPITGQAKLTAAQAHQFLAGDWYINVHTTDHKGGEVRGQVVPPKS